MAGIRQMQGAEEDQEWDPDSPSKKLKHLVELDKTSR
jgi:hypothetical protein